MAENKDEEKDLSSINQGLSPQDLKLLIKLKNELQKGRQAFFTTKINKIGLKLYDQLIDGFIGNIETAEGKIINNEKNVRLVGLVSKIYEEWKLLHEIPTVIQLINSLKAIEEENDDWFDKVEEGRKKLEKAAKEAKKYVRAKLGFNEDGLVEGGYIDGLVRDNAPLNNIKNFAFSGVTSGMNFGEFTKGIRDLINGGAETEGVINTHYKNFAYDLFHQYDSAYGKSIADEIGLKYFVYAGGLIEDSRPFCVDKNNKVYTREDAEKWKDDPRLPRTKDELKSGVLTYDPIIDRGRWNCRHHCNWITDGLGEKLIQDAQYQDLINVVDQINQGGVTYDTAKRSNLGGAPAIVVSPYPDRSMMVSGKLTLEDLKKFIDRNTDLLSKRFHVIGGWYSPDKDQTYIDISVYTNNRDKAVKLGVIYNQEGAFDLKKFEFIPTYGTGANNKPIDEKERSSLISELIIDPKQSMGIEFKDGTRKSYEQLAKEASELYAIHKPLVEKYTKELRELLPDALEPAKGRPKDIVSAIGKVFRKPDKYKSPLDLQDGSGMRVQFATIEEQYEALRLMKEKYEPLGYKIIEFDDYVAKPKDGYRAVQFIMTNELGQATEYQLRTVNQGIWADWCHDIYKPQTEVQKDLMKDEAKKKVIWETAMAYSDWIYEADKGNIQYPPPACPEEISQGFGCIDWDIIINNSNAGKKEISIETKSGFESIKIEDTLSADEIKLRLDKLYSSGKNIFDELDKVDSSIKGLEFMGYHSQRNFVTNGFYDGGIERQYEEFITNSYSNYFSDTKLIEANDIEGMAQALEKAGYHFVFVSQTPLESVSGMQTTKWKYGDYLYKIYAKPDQDITKFDDINELGATVLVTKDGLYFKQEISIDELANRYINYKKAGVDNEWTQLFESYIGVKPQLEKVGSIDFTIKELKKSGLYDTKFDDATNYNNVYKYKIQDGSDVWVKRTFSTTKDIDYFTAYTDVNGELVNIGVFEINTSEYSDNIFSLLNGEKSIRINDDYTQKGIADIINKSIEDYYGYKLSFPQWMTDKISSLNALRIDEQTAGLSSEEIEKNLKELILKDPEIYDKLNKLFLGDINIDEINKEYEIINAKWVLEKGWKLDYGTEKRYKELATQTELTGEELEKRFRELSIIKNDYIYATFGGDSKRLDKEWYRNYFGKNDGEDWKVVKLETLNPTGGVFKDYSAEQIDALPLGENITTYDKTANIKAGDKITIYRGVPDGIDVNEIRSGDFITTNKQLAQDYAGTGIVLSMTVRADEILDDITEPLGEEYILRLKTDRATLQEDGNAIYKAEGTKDLYRAVSIEDWERIQKQGFIDTSGINNTSVSSNWTFLAQEAWQGVAFQDGKIVVLRIRTEGLELYQREGLQWLMTKDPIPLDNIVAVSPVLQAIQGIDLNSAEAKLAYDVSHLLKRYAANTNQELNDYIDGIILVNTDIGFIGSQDEKIDIGITSAQELKVKTDQILFNLLNDQESEHKKLKDLALKLIIKKYGKDYDQKLWKNKLDYIRKTKGNEKISDEKLAEKIKLETVVRDAASEFRSKGDSQATAIYDKYFFTLWGEGKEGKAWKTGKQWKGNIYYAEGSRDLYRTISLKDWKRIQKQGYIDTHGQGITSVDGNYVFMSTYPSAGIAYQPSTDIVVLRIKTDGLKVYGLPDNRGIFLTPNKIPLENVVNVSPVLKAVEGMDRNETEAYVKNNPLPLIEFYNTELFPEFNEAVDKLLFKYGSKYKPDIKAYTVADNNATILKGDLNAVISNNSSILEYLNESYLSDTQELIRRKNLLSEDLVRLEKEKGKDSWEYENASNDFAEVSQLLRDRKFVQQNGSLYLSKQDLDEYANTFDTNNVLDKWSVSGEIVSGKLAGGKDDTIGRYLSAAGKGYLYRAISTEDWNRIKKQGYIDTSGVNSNDGYLFLANSAKETAMYIPEGGDGVILKISPDGLNFWGGDNISENYIVTKDNIPIANVVDVSTVFSKREGKIYIKGDTDHIVESFIEGSNKDLVKRVNEVLGNEGNNLYDKNDVASKLIGLDNIDSLDIIEKLAEPVSYLNEEEARKKIFSYTNYKSGDQIYQSGRWADWFLGQSRANKKFIVDDIKNDFELRNSMLSLFYDLYKKETNFTGTFEQFLQTDITIYRGESGADVAGLPDDAFKSFTFKRQAESWQTKYGSKLIELKIKPINTFGAINYVGGGEIEILVPTGYSRDGFDKIYEQKVNKNVRLLENNQAFYEKLIAAVDKGDYVTGIRMLDALDDADRIATAYISARQEKTKKEFTDAVEKAVRNKKKILEDAGKVVIELKAQQYLKDAELVREFSSDTYREKLLNSYITTKNYDAIEESLSLYKKDRDVAGIYFKSKEHNLTNEITKQVDSIFSQTQFALKKTANIEKQLEVLDSKKFEKIAAIDWIEKIDQKRSGFENWSEESIAQVNDMIKEINNIVPVYVKKSNGKLDLKKLNVMSHILEDADGYAKRNDKTGKIDTIILDLNLTTGNINSVDAALTFAHEFAHVWDSYFGASSTNGYSKIANLDNAGSETDSPVLKELLKAFNSSDSIDDMNKMLDAYNSGKKTYSLNGKNVRLDSDTIALIEYRLRSHEIFARAFTQYVAYKSENKDWIKFIHNESKTGSHVDKLQWWNEKDFKPIAKAFDDVFSTLRGEKIKLNKIEEKFTPTAEQEKRAKTNYFVLNKYNAQKAQRSVEGKEKSGLVMMDLEGEDSIYLNFVVKKNDIENFLRTKELKSVSRSKLVKRFEGWTSVGNVKTPKLTDVKDTDDIFVRAKVYLGDVKLNDSITRAVYEGVHNIYRLDVEVDSTVNYKLNVQDVYIKGQRYGWRAAQEKYNVSDEPIAKPEKVKVAGKLGEEPEIGLIDSQYKFTSDTIQKAKKLSKELGVKVVETIDEYAKLRSEVTWKEVGWGINYSGHLERHAMDIVEKLFQGDRPTEEFNVIRNWVGAQTDAYGRSGYTKLISTLDDILINKKGVENGVVKIKASPIRGVKHEDVEKDMKEVSIKVDTIKTIYEAIKKGVKSDIEKQIIKGAEQIQLASGDKYSSYSEMSDAEKLKTLNYINAQVAYGRIDPITISFIKENDVNMSSTLAYYVEEADGFDEKGNLLRAPNKPYYINILQPRDSGQEMIKIRNGQFEKTPNITAETFENFLLATVLHEYGHYYDFNINGGKLTERAIKLIDEGKFTIEDVRRNISKYGATEGAEAVAEAYTLYMSPHYRQLPDKTKQLISLILDLGEDFGQGVQLKTKLKTRLEQTEFTEDQKKEYSNLNPLTWKDGLTGEDTYVQDLSLKLYITEKQSLIDKYKEKYGNIVSLDKVRTMFTQVGYYGANTSAVQVATKALATDISRSLISEGRRDSVLFFANPLLSQEEAQKIFASDMKDKNLPANTNIQNTHDATIVSNLSNHEAVAKYFTDTLQMGKKLDIAYLYADPLVLWKNELREINLEHENPLQTQTITPLKIFIDSQSGSYSTIKQIVKSSFYKTKNVNLLLIDDSGLQDTEAKLIQGDNEMNSFVDKLSLSPDIIEKLKNLTVESLKSGEITQAQYDQIMKGL